MLYCVVFLLVPLLAMVTSKYPGDVCSADGQLGTIKELSSCSALQDEIRTAGSPMPRDLVIRLQQMTHGYNRHEPLVCCIETNVMGVSNNNNPTTGGGGDQYSWGTENQQGNKDPGDDKTINTRLNDGLVDITEHPNLDKLPIDCGNTNSDRISGGDRTSLYEMPWMVLLYYNSTRDTDRMCAGTLINEWYVLTSAHCVSFLGDRRALDHVTLGDWDISTDPDCEVACAPRKRDVKIDKLIPHPGYTLQTFIDDIALIRLAEPADFSLPTMGPICLPVTRQLQRTDLANLTAKVSGWGTTEFGFQSDVLLSVGLKVVNNPDCQKAYRGSPKIHEKQMCAGGEPTKDSCTGDSGGPLIYPGIDRTGGVKQVQRGVVSYGSKRCGVGLPGVYTNVAYYMDWILNNIS